MKYFHLLDPPVTMHLRLRPLSVLASLHPTSGTLPDAYSVDDPKCTAFFFVQWVLNPHNATFFYNGPEYRDQPKILLSAMIQRCRGIPIIYPRSDIYARIAGWCVPLFILIGSFQYAALGIRNALFVAVHLLSDPCTTIFSLLAKLANDKARHETCRKDLRRSDHECRSVAAILSAYDEWEDCMKAADNVPLGDHNLAGEGTYNALSQLLAPSQDITPGFSDELMGACMAAAKELVDSRADGLWKTSLGVLNYVAVCILAFLRTVVGEVNTRTGHTIAFAMLYTFLIPGVLISAMVGEFATKRSSRRILIRLQKQFDSIQKRHERPSITVFRFNNMPESELYQMLESVGGNYAFRPYQRCQGREMVALRIVAALPVLMATICAVMISYTSPTRGIGCRSVLQLLFFAVWVVSAILTNLLSRKIKRPATLWTWIRVKNLVIFIPQCAIYLAAFCGLFNSPQCWSAQISHGSKAFILLDMKPEIRALVKKTWPTLAGCVLGAQLLLVAVVAWVYRRGRLYGMLDNDLE
ncbi:MAG: hypothetical protein M1840_007021 [Geoglossum simile]|nr:MAG: hypothetical protein M1840_007021 [Geoglossum simile]